MALHEVPGCVNDYLLAQRAAGGGEVWEESAYDLAVMSNRAMQLECNAGLHTGEQEQEERVYMSTAAAKRASGDIFAFGELDHLFG